MFLLVSSLISILTQYSCLGLVAYLTTDLGDGSIVSHSPITFCCHEPDRGYIIMWEVDLRIIDALGRNFL